MSMNNNCNNLCFGKPISNHSLMWKHSIYAYRSRIGGIYTGRFSISDFKHEYNYLNRFKISDFKYIDQSSISNYADYAICDDSISDNALDKSDSISCNRHSDVLSTNKSI